MGTAWLPSSKTSGSLSKCSIAATKQRSTVLFPPEGFRLVRASFIRTFFDTPAIHSPESSSALSGCRIKSVSSFSRCSVFRRSSRSPSLFFEMFPVVLRDVSTAHLEAGIKQVSDLHNPNPYTVATIPSSHAIFTLPTGSP